ncbi:PNOC protein, partial [Grus americana]|nr:PNOC protein [Grus americana]
MRAVLWDLLLLCLFARARGDCRGDCLRCDRHLYRDSFDVLVCILECEGEAVPRATWELCAAAAGRAIPRPRDLQDDGDPWRGVVAAVPAVPVSPLQVSELLRRREAEDEGSARKWNNQKRFSEFLKQYLGMSPRSSEYDIAGGISEHNEI